MFSAVKWFLSVERPNPLFTQLYYVKSCSFINNIFVNRYIYTTWYKFVKIGQKPQNYHSLIVVCWNRDTLLVYNMINSVITCNTTHIMYRFTVQSHASHAVRIWIFWTYIEGCDAGILYIHYAEIWKALILIEQHKILMYGRLISQLSRQYPYDEISSTVVSAVNREKNSENMMCTLKWMLSRILYAQIRFEKWL